MPPDDEIDLHLLREIAADPATSQRSLARRLGVSLGRVNYCLRALADKGLLKANNFRRSDNKRAYAYVLTPKGVDEKVRLTVSFLQRKMIEYDRLQLELESLRREVGEMTERN
jgi:EPS-associated MarR family transcriptional regulator